MYFYELVALVSPNVTNLSLGISKVLDPRHTRLALAPVQLIIM